jgi:hypothetical protein
MDHPQKQAQLPYRTYTPQVRLHAIRESSLFHFLQDAQGLTRTRVEFHVLVKEGVVQEGEYLTFSSDYYQGPGFESKIPMLKVIGHPHLWRCELQLVR